MNPDCGLKTRAWPETLLALGNMVQAARVLRQEIFGYAKHYDPIGETYTNELILFPQHPKEQLPLSAMTSSAASSGAKPLKEARQALCAQARLTQRELRQVEDAEIVKLIAKQKALGLHAVTDGEYRRSWWHLDFLWNLEGVQKVAAEQGSIAFKGRQTKAETIEIVSRIDFGAHPFIDDFKAVQAIAGDTPTKFTIPSPSMLHLITAVRNQHYSPIGLYTNNDNLLADIAAAYKKAVAAFYAAGCRYLQFDDTSWGEFCSEEKRGGLHSTRLRSGSP